MSLPTKAEIDARYDERSKQDAFGFEVHEYVSYMSFEKLQTICKPEVTEEQVREMMEPLDRGVILAKMKDYMEFAWDKANGCRGISASRSLSHYVAWTWLVGDIELSQKVDEPYEYYGKSHLRMICEHYGWDADAWDDEIRVNNESELEAVQRNMPKKSP